MGCCLSTRTQRPRLESEMAPGALTDSIQTPGVSDHPECAGEEQGSQETSGSGDQPQDVSSSSGAATHTDQIEEMVITSIRATDVALGLRRVPAGFYAVVCHSGLEWRTETKCSSMDIDVIEWNVSIPIVRRPSDLSATVCLQVYASFELQPMLGTGERLRELIITVEELLDCSAKDIREWDGFLRKGLSPHAIAAFTLLPMDGNVVSSCSSIRITAKYCRSDSNDSSGSMVLAPHCSITESLGELEDATNQGHRALSRYRKYRERRDLECSVEQFESALSVCPLDHPCLAAAQSNLAMAKFIICQVENTNASLEVPLGLYHNALATRPVGHLDRPSTMLHMAIVHFARFERQRDTVERARAETLLVEAIELSSIASHENRAAAFLLQLHAARREDPVRADGQSSVEKHSALRSTDEDTKILSVELLHRFERFGDLTDLQQAIIVLQELVRSTPIWDDQYSAALGNLALALSYRFNHVGELSDLEDAISKQRTAVELTPHGHSHKPSLLHNLGNSFRARFERLGQISDLENASFEAKGCCRAHSAWSPSQRLGQPSDLEDAILKQRDAVELTPHGHPHKPSHLNNLGNSFLARFKRFGQLSDLEDAISKQRDAVELTPHGHPHKPSLLNNLGSTFLTRFERLGQLSDLEDAISALRDAVKSTPHGHPHKPSLLHNLGNSIRARFERLGQLCDLEDAISRQRDAVELTLHAHPHKSSRLNNLGNSLLTRFEHLGQLNDLEDAISKQRDASPSSLVSSASGRLRDLEDAILKQRDSVELTLHGHPDKPSRLNNLGSSFLTRFECLGQLSDLEDAISALRYAVELTPHGHPDKPSRLNNLGNSFRARFERLGQLDDLEDAISRQRDAVELTPHVHPNKPNRLNNLGNSFRARFERLGQLGDLEDAISKQSDAVELTPHGHPDKPSRLNNLGNSFRARFERLGQLIDLEDAISSQRDGVDLTPHDHPHRPLLLSSLGNSFRARFERLGEPSDVEQAIRLYSHAASAPIGPISVRFRASQEWISCARNIHHHSLLGACFIAITLLPQLPWIGLSLAHRYSELTRGADVVREAAAAALDLGLPETAVEWLEQGRSIVWGELFQLRSSYEELSSAHPEHARRLRELSAALEHASTAREQSLSALEELSAASEHVSIPRENSLSPLLEHTQSSAIRSLQVEADIHRALAIERDELLHEIRRFPGFERFLFHKEFSRLRASAYSGPVVVLNATESRCDALVVLADVDRVIHVPLPNFTFKQSMFLQKMLEKLLGHSRGIHPDERKAKLIASPHDLHPWNPETPDGDSYEFLLSNLWEGVVRPVLDALAFKVCDVMPLEFKLNCSSVFEQTPGDPSRIFWCPTGPFAFLPIHGAGFYDTQHAQSGHNVSDFVVSSYIPTLSILTLLPNCSTPPSGDLRLLAVRQPSSDGLRHLSGVTTELTHIREVIRDSPSAHITLLESSDGTVEGVLSLMKEADWVHFACHGIQDDVDSGLCLANQRRLKLRDIIAVSRPHGGLAFLSACQTAMGDERLSDEAIHISAGMLFAGYGGVIGTMWSISDNLAPDLARDVYGQLFRTGIKPDYREAARALHEATGRLRHNNASFLEWLPFIHVGL
ncbi:CHAT domain-containing protein [Boletus coccyginus]|nr:CHAT domain-containing protein [Boletus coccyginus]